MREILSSIGCGVHSAQMPNNEMNLGNSGLRKRKNASEPDVTTAELSAYEVFLAHLSDLLIFKRIASIGGISDTITRDMLEQNVYGHLATGTLSYICYDLAAQNLVKSNIECRGSGSACQYFSQEELMRVLVLAFGHTLSTQQRKTILQSLTEKLSGSDDLPHNKDEYLNLLHTVDNLRSYSNPDVADSQYMHIVANAVDSLANMVLGENAGVTGTDTHVQILALEGILLIRSMVAALVAVVKGEKVNSSLKRRCVTDLTTALRYEGELHSIALGNDITHGSALYVYKNFKNMIYGLQLRANIHMPSNSVKILAGMESILGQVRCVIERIGTISRSEASGSIAPWIKVRRGQSVPCNTRLACIGLSNNYPIVDYVYQMVVCGSLDEWTVLNKLYNETGKGASAESVNDISFVSDRKLRWIHDNAVIFQTEKLLENLVNEKSSRRQGKQEVRSMEEVYGILNTLVQKHTQCRRTESVNSATEAFRHLLVNIYINLTCGDVFRVMGGPYRNNPVANYRMLALYTHVFCNTSPSVQQSSRASLREAFKKCGEKLPHEIDDMLCVLIDIKNIIHGCGHTAHGSNSTDNVNIEDVHRSNSLKVLAKLMAVQHVLCNNKIEGDPQLERLVKQHLCGIRMLDVAEILLRESTSLCKTVSELQSHGGSGKSAGICFTNDALTALLWVQKLKEKTTCCSASKSADTHVRKICTAIDEQMKKISDTSKRCANISGLDSKTSVTCLSNIVKTLHKKVWNENGHSKAPCDAEIDKNLLAYMLGGSYLSSRYALEIMTDNLWKSEVDMPSFKRLLGYFRCYKVIPYEETTLESSMHSDHGSESTNATHSSLDGGGVVTGTKVSHLNKVDVAGVAEAIALSHHI